MLQVLAQAKPNLGQQLGINFGVQGGATVGKLISNVVQSAIIIAGLIFLFLILNGGFTMIKSSGKNDPQSYAKAQSMLTSAILGFILVLVAYWIILIIQVILGGEPFITRPGF
jgi:hypothetical protein